MGKTKPQIILFGDSITELSFQVDKAGWGAALTNHYARKADVVMRGFSGYNSRLALCLLDTVFPIPSSNKPLLVTVWFGSNDSCISDRAFGFVHVPLAEYRENLKKIVAHIKKLSDSTHIVLITPPPIDEKNLLIFSETVWMRPCNGVCPMSNEAAKAYADECVKVAQELDLPVINLWSTFTQAPDWAKYLCDDGLHLSAEGNNKAFEELLKVMEEPSLVPTVKADQMPIDFPHFVDFGSDPYTTVKNYVANLDK